jgi:hypothetical protein
LRLEAKQRKLEDSIDLSECTFKPQTNIKSDELTTTIQGVPVIERLAQHDMVMIGFCQY